MKKLTSRISKAIDIFLDAINEGTLAKGTCAACAVGNLVAKGIGMKIPEISIVDDGILENEHWMGILQKKGCGYSLAWANDVVGTNNIESTDFNWKELRFIENEFENNTKIYYNEYNYYTKKEIREDQIKGLEAVVKVMMTFDELEEDVKEVFTSKAELIEL